MINWDELENVCLGCKKGGLCQTRTNVVFGTGNKNADILFIGEGPGEQEDLQGEPFVGPAGKFLDDMLSIIDLNRDNVYIANIVKCGPPQTRDPFPEEQSACMDYLRAQFLLVQPKIIVCLGRVAARKIIREDFVFAKDRGVWYCLNGVWTIAIYHPSALLRDPSKRPDTFSDLLRIRERIREVHAEI